MVFIFSTLVTFVILHGVIEFKKDWILIIEGVAAILMLFLYLSLLLPPKKKDQDKIENYINEPRKICFECVRKKPKRSYHCDICKVCI